MSDLDAAAKELTNLKLWRDQWAALGLMVPELDNILALAREAKHDIPALTKQRDELQKEVDGLDEVLKDERASALENLQVELDREKEKATRELRDLKTQIEKDSQALAERAQALKTQQTALEASVQNLTELEKVATDKLKAAEDAYTAFKKKAGIGS